VRSIGIAAIAFAFVFGGSLAGFLLRKRVSEQHLNTDTKDAMKMVIGLVSTMVALVLGLLIASAKSSFDARSGAVDRLSADLIHLDTTMAHYGTEMRPVRDLLRQTMTESLERVAPEGDSKPLHIGNAEGVEGATGLQRVEHRLYALVPQNDEQRQLKARALTLVWEFEQTRLSILERSESAIPMPFLVLLVSWLTFIFFAFNLLTSRSIIVVLSMFAGALCVSSAIFIILELDSPYEGVMKISIAPLRSALATIGK
jgi:hypothetical protein